MPFSLYPHSVLFDDDYDDDDYNDMVFFNGFLVSRLIEMVFIVCRFICSFVIVLVFGFRIGLIHFIP